MKYELKDYQQKTVKEAKNKWGLWFKMRVGKTPTAIRLATTRAKNALVICPKHLTEQWQKEIERWNNKKGFEFEVISKETFRRDWNKIEKKDAIIIDECQRAFGNYKSKTYKTGAKYFKKHKTEYIWLLSGTPRTATSWSIYSYGKILSRKWKWREWNNLFYYNVRMGNRIVPVAKEGMEDRLLRITKSIGTVIDLKDVAEVPDDENIFEYFDLNPLQKKTIKELDDVLPNVRYNHIHQIESGTLKSDGYSENLQFECQKDKRLKELVEENNKIIIVAMYLLQIDKYEKLFKNCGKEIFIIRGGTKKLASEIAKEAEKSYNAIIIIQSNTCDGYSLKSFDLTVFASLSYSFVDYEQICHRNKATDKKTPNTYIHLLSRNKTVNIGNTKSSMDEAVYNSVSKKQDFSTKLFNKNYENNNY